MAKRFVTISLATKLRLLFGAAVLVIIAAALVVPWLFMERLAEQGVQRAGEVLTELRLNEFIRDHYKVSKEGKHASEIAALYVLGRAEQSDSRAGPVIIRLADDMKPDRVLDSSAKRALKAFRRNPGQDLAVMKAEDKQGRSTYRCFRAVRVSATRGHEGRSCMDCHGPKEPVYRQFQLGQFVGMIDATMP